MNLPCKMAQTLGLLVAFAALTGCPNASNTPFPTVPSAAPSASPTPNPKREIKGQASSWKSTVELLELATDFTGSGKGLADWYYTKAKKEDATKAAPAVPPNSYMTSPVPTDDGKAVVIKICVAREPGVCPSPGSGADRPWPATPTPSVAVSAAASVTPVLDNKQGEWIIPPTPSPTPTPEPLGVITLDPTPSPAAK